MDHVLHEIFITEFSLAVREEATRREDVELLTVQRRSLSRHSAFRLSFKGKVTRLIPDAFFLFRQNPGGMCCCIVEMDAGTMNRKRLVAKYRRYEAWANSQAGQDYLLNLYCQHGASNPRPNFRVLFVAHGRAGQDDGRRLAELVEASRHAPDGIRQRCWFTAVEAIREHRHEDLCLAPCIWLRSRDLALTGGSQALAACIASAPRQALSPLPSAS